MTSHKPSPPGTAAADERTARMIRVDHAGEYGAVRIYQGQLAVLGKDMARDPEAARAHAAITDMVDKERRHLEAFEDMITARRVRPTALSPLWHAAGFALGAGTALLGTKAAMVCTTAVEEVIEEHYAGQLADLGGDDPELAAMVEEFRDDEIAHGAVARDFDAGGEDGAAAKAPGPYDALAGVIKAGSRLAIWLSTRI
ncbi:MAG: demethoxyubiquinone hydroxylase family protein [Alphaproteobacteria bacterium]